MISLVDLYTTINETVKSVDDIKITDDMRKHVQQFDTSIDLLKAGGFTIDMFDRAAHGFAEDDITELHPSQLNIKWQDDIENVHSELHKFDGSNEDWARQVSLATPIEVVYEYGKFYVDDGHHRYMAAKILNKSLPVTLQIKDKPLKKLAPDDMSYDDYHHYIFNKVKQDTSG